jgi:hypothetical protein
MQQEQTGYPDRHSLIVVGRSLRFVLQPWLGLGLRLLLDLRLRVLHQRPALHEERGSSHSRVFVLPAQVCYLGATTSAAEVRCLPLLRLHLDLTRRRRRRPSLRPSSPRRRHRRPSLVPSSFVHACPGVSNHVTNCKEHLLRAPVLLGCRCLPLCPSTSFTTGLLLLL